MPDLGNAVLTLRVAGDKFKKGLSDARTQTGDFAEKSSKQVGKVGQALGDLRTQAANAAQQIPLIGGAVSKMVTAMTGPVGIAVAAIAGIGIAAAAVIKGVGDVAKETETLRKEVGLSAEAAQGWVDVAKVMGSDADTITDMFREMGIRLGELATVGSGPAKDALAALNIPLERLQELSPEEQFTLIHQELGKIEDPAKAAFLAEELFGGSVEKAGNFLKTNTEELVKHVDAFKEHNAHSGDVIDASEDMKELWGQLKGVLGPVGKDLAAILIPAIRDLMQAIIPYKPLITTLISGALTPLKIAFSTITTVLNVISALLRGDFTGALNHIKDHFITIATTLLDTGAKVVGLFNKDWADSIKGVSDDLKGMKTDTKKEMPQTSKAIKKETDKIETNFKDVGTASETMRDDVKDAAKKMADAFAASSQAMSDASNTRITNLLDDYAEEVKAEGERIREREQFWDDVAEKDKNYRDDKHAADMDAWGVTDVEYGLAQASLETLSSDKYAELITQAEEFGIKDLALLHAHNKNLAGENLQAEKDAATAKKTADDAAAQKEKDHRAALLTTYNSHIALLNIAIGKAHGAEKTALETQLTDLKGKRDAAYVVQEADLLAAKKSQIDAVAAKIKTAEGAELTALKAHHLLLVAEMAAMVTATNAELAKIEREIQVDVNVNRPSSEDQPGQVRGGSDPRSTDDGSSSTRTVNPDGTIDEHTQYPRWFYQG